METTIFGSADGCADSPGADVDLEERFAVVCGHLNALHGSLVDLAAEAVATRRWEGWGFTSPAHWLSIQTGSSIARARDLVEVAARSGELPAVVGGLRRGELSLEQVVPIVKRAPSWADVELAEFARYATVSQLRRTVASYHWGDPPPDTAADTAAGTAAGTAADTAPGDDASDAGRVGPSPVEEFVSLTFADDGVGRLTGRLDVDNALELDAALREARDALVRDGGHDIGWADALVEMARRSLDAVTSRSRRDRFRIYVHLDDGRVTGPHGQRLPAAVADLALCDGVVRPVQVHDGVPVSVGRTRYLVPDHTRRLVIHRDRGCRIPGCTAARHLEVHHIVRYPDGPTDTPNLLSLCPHHHRAHHRGDITISGDADQPGGLTIVNRHGQPIGARPARPPGGPPPPPTGRYQHPTGETLQQWAVHFNPPPHLRPHWGTTN